MLGVQTLLSNASKLCTILKTHSKRVQTSTTSDLLKPASSSTKLGSVWTSGGWTWRGVEASWTGQRQKESHTSQRI